MTHATKMAKNEKQNEKTCQNHGVCHNTHKVNKNKPKIVLSLEGVIVEVVWCVAKTNLNNSPGLKLYHEQM